MQMMNFHKVKTQDRMKFELQIPFIVIEASYNSDKKNRMKHLLVFIGDKNEMKPKHGFSSNLVKQ